MRKYIISIALLLFGAIFLVAGVIGIRKNNAKKEIYSTVTGTLTQYQENQRSGGSTSYRCTYTYIVDGSTYSYTDPQYATSEPEIGDSKEVWYNPDDPQEAFTDGVAKGGMFAIMFGLALICFGIFSCTNASIKDEQLRNKIASILIGMIFAIMGFGLVIIVGMGNIMVLLVLGLFGILGLYLIGSGIVCIVTGKESKFVVNTGNNRPELSPERQRQKDMFVAEHGETIRKIEDTAYDVKDITNAVGSMIMGIVLMVAVVVWAGPSEIILAIQEQTWKVILAIGIFLLFGLFTFIRGAIKLIRFLKNK